MESPLIVGVLILIVYPIILGGRISALEKRLDALAKQLSNLANGQPTPVSTPTTPAQIPPPQQFGQGVAPVMYPTLPPQEKESAFVTWLKQDTLVKVGALLLVLAAAWFVTYAFANNWIGPVGRITLGLFFGASLLAYGVKRMALYREQGSIFVALGSTVVILTVTAAQYVYEMFPALVALGLMFLAVVLTALISLQYERTALAYTSLILALLAPFLTNSEAADPLLFMLYLLLIVAGTLWVVWRLKAEKITLVALFGVLVYTSLAYELDTGVALLFSFVFTGIFFITNIVSLIRRYTEWVSPTHVVTAVLTGAYLIASIMSSAPEEWMSTYLVLWALIFAYGSHQVFLRTLNKIPFYIYAAVSVFLLGIATAVELHGAVLTIALTLEVLVCVALFTRLRASRKLVNIATALFVVPGLLTVGHIDSFPTYGPLLNADLFALLVFTGAVVLAGLARSMMSPESGDLLESGQKVLYSIAGVYGAIILWLVLHNLFSDMVATMLALIVYSLLGLVLYITGRTTGDTSVKKAGSIVLVLVIIRLLMVDVWALEMTGRIITFLVIGLLFMSTAFLPKANSSSNPNE